jgi:hypothetical protein
METTSAEACVSHAGESVVALHPCRPAVTNAAKRASGRRILPLETLCAETFTGLSGSLATPNVGSAVANAAPKRLPATKPFR